MLEKFLQEKYKIGRHSKTLKDWILHFPKSYVVRKFLGEEGFAHEEVFQAKIIEQKIGKQLILKAIVNQKILTIIHSNKLRGIFSVNCTVTLAGKIEKNVCFYPSLCKYTKGIFPLYEYIKGDKITTLINKIPNSPLQENLKKIHQPKDIEEVNEACNKLLQMEITIVKDLISQNRLTKIPMKKHRNLILPFELSHEQKKLWDEIQKDLESEKCSIRLIYGEVGSGKTILAILAAHKASINGVKVCFLVPTLVLAEQIFENFKKITDLEISLVTSKSKKREGNILIGTQALLYEEINNVGLLIVDEQHRFGVNQRNLLIQSQTEVLMMSATPIPRTMEMALSGLIKVSEMKHKPKKHRVETFVVHDKNKFEILDKIIKKESRTVWVTKTIEEAETLYKKYTSIFPKCYLLNSKIKNKSEILQQIHKNGGLLFSTTVIEVGIDILIDFIIIEKADQFGLAQIHQLRGRVGRHKNGVCILIGTNIQKLSNLKNNETGFEISEIDLKKRGGGKIAGIEQSGLQQFYFALEVIDYKLKKKEKFTFDNSIEINEILKQIIYENIKLQT